MSDNGKLFSILAYLIFIVSLIWYFADSKMQKNTFAKFHFKQALVLVIVSVIVSVVGSAVPFIGWFIIAPIGGILVLIWAILGIVNAATGKEKDLFMIGKFAHKFDF